MWDKILVGAISCAVTLIITHIFTTAINAPKKQREQREREAQERKNEMAEMMKAIQCLRADLKMQDCRMKEDFKSVKAGLQAVLKNELKVRYFKWLELGYAPEDAKDDLERMYTAYHNLGANGVMDHLRERFLDLPESK